MEREEKHGQEIHCLEIMSFFVVMVTKLATKNGISSFFVCVTRVNFD